MRTYIVAILSTAHVSKETAQLLNSSPCAKWPIHGGPCNETGWFMYCHDENTGETTDQDYIPDDLFSLMTAVRKRGCDYILFDCDEEPNPDFHVYDW